MRKLNLWTGIAWALAAFFLFAAYSNASGVTAQSYVNWGYPAGFHYVTAALEFLVGISLLSRRSRIYGAALGGAVMVAAVLTLFAHGAVGSALPALLTLAVALAVGVQAWRSGAPVVGRA